MEIFYFSEFSKENIFILTKKISLNFSHIKEGNMKETFLEMKLKRG